MQERESSVEQLEAGVRELVATIQCPHLRRLLAAILASDGETWARFREAPAAKHYHQAYRHGLLEHSLTVAQAVSAISVLFGGIDRDVAVTAALLHDIGKLDVYELTDDGIEMNDRGRLHGEIALGYFRVRAEIERIEGFPEALSQGLLHIILSHHGTLEHGSPVLPCTREATVVHMADNLSSKLGSFDRVQQTLADGDEWARWDKGVGGPAYFGAASEPVHAQAA